MRKTNIIIKNNHVENNVNENNITINNIITKICKTYFQ